jgi:tubulin monoglycylase TTLL3/8
MLSENIDVDRFFPKCFDMSDLQDFENFHEVYKWVYAAALLKNSIN